MGAKGKTETVSKVVAAFAKARTSRQAELAHELEIQPKHAAEATRTSGDRTRNVLLNGYPVEPTARFSISRVS